MVKTHLPKASSLLKSLSLTQFGIPPACHSPHKKRRFIEWTYLKDDTKGWY